MPKGDKLTEKQKRFVREYLVDLNATQAAIRAGYSKKVASVMGFRNIANDNIQAELVELREHLKKTLDVDAADVIREFKRIGFSTIKDYVSVDEDGLPDVDLSDLNDDQWAALSEASTTVTTTSGKDSTTLRKTSKIRCHSKTDALDKLAKHLGLYEEDNKQRVVNVHIHKH